VPTDDLDALIAEVEREFKVVHGAQRVAFAIGDLESNEKARHPRIEWREPDGAIGPQRTVGGHDPEQGEDADDTERPEAGSIATLKPNLEVDCWGANRAAARTLVKHLILAAQRANKFGLTFSRYEHVQEHHRADGVKFRLFGECELNVPAETEATVGYITLRRHEWDVSSEGETVHGENEAPEP
jgi:hypothetical protein